jgi:hypothetical protein
MISFSSWSELYHSLEIEAGHPPAGPTKFRAVLQVPKPEINWLDDYEVRSGFRLPVGYREFIQVFGPGELGDGYKIRAPGYRLTGQGQDARVFNFQVDLDEFNAHPDWSHRKFKEPDQIMRLVYFADDSNGDLYGWDPQYIRSHEPTEYAIYVVEREEDERARLVATSFVDFVNNRVLGPVGDYSPSRKFRVADFRPYSRHMPKGAWLERAIVTWTSNN